MTAPGQVVAVLGPTNTGKTHYAIERMLSHRSGVIGLPLRLLAREVYDRIVAARGPSVVALVTGEERIVPPRTQYWVCTVEAMPTGIGADFLAVDEIQIAADPERGHVFTDRLLNARGRLETLFLGADTMRPTIRALVPEARFMRRERLSTLSHGGTRKLSRMPPRSAVVAFSVESVYAIAELIRRQKGGCAVVMGALSPRTRNAQVELYQSGQVDHLVATDAIGMGLNLDIDHVAFAGLSKFDGRRMRPLAAHELAQIAGRAGRGEQPGSFGVTGEAPALDEGVADAITSHRFAPVRRLQWRNALLDFASPERLIASLEETSGHALLTRAREADDLRALRDLAGRGDVRERLNGPGDVRLLWDVCRIPDFRAISAAEHAGMLARILGFLHASGRVPDDWLAGHIRRIDRTDGDIDALSTRLAYVRTWTYVAQRPGWVSDESHWRDATRAVEDRLSDALHAALTKRFVDRRTSLLQRRLKQKESLVAEVDDDGAVTVEGAYVGRLEGFRFRPDASQSAEAARTLRQASLAALRPHFHLRAERLYNAPDTEFDITEQGGLMWGEMAVGRLAAGDAPLAPKVETFVEDDVTGAEVAEKVARRLGHYVDRRVATLFEPLIKLRDDAALEGPARGFAFRMVEAFAILPREGVAEEVRALDQGARASLRRHGLRFGQYTVFMPALLKPAPTRLRLVLWGLAQGMETFPESPPPGLVTIPVPEGTSREALTMMGYRAAGARAIRIDMLERLADMLRARDARAGFEASADMLSITGLSLAQFADLMAGLGYRAEAGEREKRRAAPRTGETPGATGAPAEARPSAPEAGAAPAAREDAQPAAGTDEASPEPGPTPETAGAAAPEGATDGGKATAPEAGGARATGEDAQAETGTGETGSEAEPTPEPTDAAAPETDDAAREMETFYTFTWAPRRQHRPRQGEGEKPRRAKGGKPGRAGKAGDKPPSDKDKTGAAPGGKPRQGKPQPPRERPIDPNNPFAEALAGLKDKL